MLWQDARATMQINYNQQMTETTRPNLAPSSIMGTGREGVYAQ